MQPVFNNTLVGIWFHSICTKGLNPENNYNSLCLVKIDPNLDYGIYRRSIPYFLLPERRRAQPRHP
jgi:hypothetical protein